MQITDQNEVAEATEDTPNENLSSDDLLNFIASEPVAEESTEEEVTTDETEVETESEDGNEEVLSQSEDQEEVEDGDDQDDQEEEDKTPKSVQKLVKQIGKLTARAKTAEENYQAIQAEVSALRKTESEEKAQSASVSEVETFEQLEELRQQAIGAKKWARKHEGESFVEEGGQEYTKEQIKEIRDNAEDHLDEAIPARMKFLQERAQSDQQALETFTFLKDSNSPEAELLQQINANERFKVLDTLPNGLYIKSLIVEGCKSVRTKSSKPATKQATKKVPKVLSEPMSEVSPPVRKVKNKSSVLGKGNVSEDQLIAFLS
jgi:hypothetical protein